MWDIFDLCFSVAKKLVGVSNEGKEGEFHVLDSSDGLEDVFDVIAIGSIVVLVHPEAIDGKEEVWEGLEGLSDGGDAVKSARYLYGLLL